MASGGQDWKIAATAELVGHGVSHADGGVDTFSLEGLPGSSAGLQDHKALTPASATKPHNIAEVDETSPSTTKNKTVSNALAKGWEEIKNAFDAGIIVLWSGLLSSIPTGWALCDGNGGRPNLLDKFVKGVPNGSTDPGSTGGSSTHDHGAATGSHVLTESELPAHTHTYDQPAQVGDTNGHNGWDGTGVDAGAASGSVGSDSGHTHTISGASSNPAFYEIAFIIKT